MRKERKERESEEKNDMDIELETHRDYFGRNYIKRIPQGIKSRFMR